MRKASVREAADNLLAIVKADRTWSEDAARQQLLQFFEAWGTTDEVDAGQPPQAVVAAVFVMPGARIALSRLAVRILPLHIDYDVPVVLDPEVSFCRREMQATVSRPTSRTTVPVFPLSAALLLPGGRMPLNIFEPRYHSDDRRGDGRKAADRHDPAGA